MQKENLAMLSLRLGMAITFIWIGVYIFQAPEDWSGYLQSWAGNLVPFPLKWLMLFTAFLDISIGILFALNLWIKHAALAASFHLAIILITSGINAITVRDIGLLGATLFLVFHSRK